MNSYLDGAVLNTQLSTLSIILPVLYKYNPQTTLRLFGFPWLFPSLWSIAMISSFPCGPGQMHTHTVTCLWVHPHSFYTCSGVYEVGWCPLWLQGKDLESGAPQEGHPHFNKDIPFTLVQLQQQLIMEMGLQEATSEIQTPLYFWIGQRFVKRIATPELNTIEMTAL